MRHFDAWLLRDPYSIWHYYSTGRRWQETVRHLIQERKICAPSINDLPSSNPIDPYTRSIDPQSNCSFFQKLPPEIRLIIYNYVFGDEAIHLVQLKDKIRHVRCQHTSSSIESNRHCCPVTPARWRAPGTTDTDRRLLYPHTHAQLPETLSNSSLALLRTCRAIYTEAADLPYSNPVFDVDDLHTFIAFSLTICPDRLNSIRKLTVQWTPIWQPMAGEDHKSSIYSHTHNDRLWTLFWVRIAALRGLEELHLSLDLGRFNATGGGISRNRLRLSMKEPWVRPMLNVRGLRHFDLGITVRCDAHARRALEDVLRRDAVTLRDHLREIMCSAPSRDYGRTIPERCCLMEDWNQLNNCECERGLGSRPRQAITAA